MFNANPQGPNARLMDGGVPPGGGRTSGVPGYGRKFMILTAATSVGVDHGMWLAAVFVLPAAALLVRLFMIQHDCGHGSFFRSRHANDMLGRLLGILTLTPYEFWRERHAVHHASFGNLDRRGTGDITMLTRCASIYRCRTGGASFTGYIGRVPLGTFAHCRYRALYGRFVQARRSGKRLLCESVPES